MKKIIIGIAGALMVAVIPATAFAHVTVQPNEALGGSFSKFVVRVPTEGDDASTIKVEVKFPPLAFVGFADVPGWTREVAMRKLNKPIEAFGETLQEVVGTATWTGGEVAPGEFIEFPFSAATPEGENTLKFPAIQTYSSGEVVRWTGPEDADEPASTVTTVELGEFQEEGLGELGTLHEVVHELEELGPKVDEIETTVGEFEATKPAASEDETDDEDSDVLPLALGGLGAGLGAIALIVSLTRRRA